MQDQYKQDNLAMRSPEEEEMKVELHPTWKCAEMKLEVTGAKPDCKIVKGQEVLRFVT